MKNAWKTCAEWQLRTHKTTAILFFPSFVFFFLRHCAPPCVRDDDGKKELCNKFHPSKDTRNEYNEKYHHIANIIHIRL